MSLRARLLLYFGLTVGFGVAVFVVLWLFGLPLIGVEGIQANEYRRSIVAVESLADKERDTFAAWFASRRRELRLLSADENFSANVVTFGKHRAKREQQRLERALNAISEANPGAYHYLYLYDPAGDRILAAASSLTGPVPAPHRALLAEAAGPGMSEFVGIVAEGSGYAAMITSQVVAMDEDGVASGRLAGILVASVALGAPLQNDETSIRQALGDSGMALLIGRQRQVIFKTPDVKTETDFGYVTQQKQIDTEGVKLLTAPNGHELIAVFRHLNLGASDGVSLAVARDTDEALAANNASFLRMAVLGIVIFSLLMSLAIFAANRIAAFESEIRALNAGLEHRVDQRTQELEQANASLRETLENLQSTRDELVRSEKLAGLGAMVAGVAHELNTPIGNALLVASSMSADTDEFKLKATSRITRASLNAHIESTLTGAMMLVTNLERAADLVRGFKQLAADQTSERRRRFLLADVINEVMLSMVPRLRLTPFKVELAINEELEMDSYPGPLTQIIVNFLNNALLHAFEGRRHGTMHLSARRLPGERIEMIFSDDGKGMSADVLHRVFDPFFTTKLGQGGSGIGMYIVFNIATKILGGTLDVESEADAGTRWVLQIPCVAS